MDGIHYFTNEGPFFFQKADYKFWVTFFFLNLPLCWSNHTYGQVYLLLGNVSGEQCGP